MSQRTGQTHTYKQIYRRSILDLLRSEALPSCQSGRHPQQHCLPTSPYSFPCKLGTLSWKLLSEKVLDVFPSYEPAPQAENSAEGASGLSVFSVHDSLRLRMQYEEELVPDAKSQRTMIEHARGQRYERFSQPDRIQSYASNGPRGSAPPEILSSDLPLLLSGQRGPAESKSAVQTPLGCDAAV